MCNATTKRWQSPDATAKVMVSTRELEADGNQSRADSRPPLHSSLPEPQPDHQTHDETKDEEETGETDADDIEETHPSHDTIHHICMTPDSDPTHEALYHVVYR